MKLKATGRLFNKLLALMLAVAMAVLLIPAETYAYLGAVRILSADEFNAIHSGTVRKNNGDTYAYVENDYIYFEILMASTGGNRDKVGKLAHTVPQALITDKKADFSSFGEQIVHYQINEAIKNDELVQNEEWTDIGALSFDTSQDDYQDTGNGYISFSLKAAKNYSMYVYFGLQSMDAGSTQSERFPDYLGLDPEDKTQTWGVYFSYQIWSDKEPEMVRDPYSYWEQYVPKYEISRVDVEYKNFSKMGHANADANLSTVRAEMYDNGNLKSLIINAGLGETKYNQVVEVYSDSYEFASPFVATSHHYRNYEGSMWQDPYGIQGQGSHFPIRISYEKCTLHTMTEPYSCQGMDGGMGLWGFRNLKTKAQLDEEQSSPDALDPDNVTLSSDSQYLYVRKSGSRWVVAEAKDKSKIPSDSVAIYRGSFDYASDGYVFKDGAVELSSTIKMSWNTKKTTVKLKSDGTLTYDSRFVSLSSPTFKFFAPNNAATKDSLKFIGYDVSNKGSVDKGIVFDMKPSANDAIINVNIPGNEVAARRAAIGKDGNLIFSGDLNLSLFLASIDMPRLGYGPDGKNGFKLYGFEAKGGLKVPKKPGDDDDDSPGEDAKPSILGFGGAKVEGDISTFQENEHYKFEFELTIQNLFSTQAMLNLVRLKNGKLCPNDLSFDLKMENGMGIDITPAAPAVTITGGGGGISDLAKTIDGDYSGIPPVVLSLRTHGTVVKVVDGTLELKIGPSQLQLKASDIGFKVGNENLKIIKELYAGIYVNSKDVKYKGYTYSGYEFGGNLGIGIALITKEQAGSNPFKKLFVECVTAEAELKVNTIAAERRSGSKRYFYGYLGFSGHAGCDFKIPIIDKKVLGAAIDFSIGGESATEMGSVSGVGQFLKNLEIKGGIAATAYIGKYYGQVIYILPSYDNDYSGELHLDAGKGSASFDWDDYLNNSKQVIVDSRSGMTLLAAPQLVTLEDGEEAIALAVSNTSELDSSVKKVSNNLKADPGVTKQVTIDKDDIPDGESAIIAVVPTDENDIDSVFDSISTDIPGWTANKLTTDEVDANDSQNYNVWQGGIGYDEEGNPEKQAVYLDISKDQIPDSGKFNISADKNFKVITLSTSPVTGLDGSIDSDNLTVQVTNPADGANYSLRTYYGTKDENGMISQDYLVETHEIPSSDVDNPQVISLTKRGDFAPTGNYYVTTQLVDELNVPVATYESTETVSFTNDTVPEEPAEVTLEKLGGERLLGTWSEVADSAKYTVDGYKVNIYQKEGDEYIDTGRGYTFDRADLDAFKAGETAIDGLSYDENTGKYSLDMALTVGGEDEGVEPLSTGKNYKIGVRAYTNKQVEMTEGTEEMTAPAYGPEGLSAGVVLQKYDPVSFEMSFNGEELTKNPDSGIYEYRGQVPEDRDTILSLTSIKNKHDEDVSWDEIDATITKVGETDEFGNPVTLYHDYGDVYVPDFDGILQLEVKVAHNHDGVSDETVEYVNIERDNIAPIISVDEDIIYADSEGNFEISGVAEAGSKVECGYSYNKLVVDEEGDVNLQTIDHNEDVDIADDGSFSVTGKLDDSVDNLAVWFTATDDCDNVSEAAMTFIAGRLQATPEPSPTPTPTPTAPPTEPPAATDAPTEPPTEPPAATDAPTAEPTDQPETPTESPVITDRPTTAPDNSNSETPTTPPTGNNILTPPAATTVPVIADKAKSIKITSVNLKKNAKKITGKLNISGARVKIKVAKKPFRKAAVKGRKFTLKLPYALKKKMKVTIKATKTGCKGVTKAFKVK